MDLKKGKGSSSYRNGEGVQKRSSKCTDHWAFLKEIDAPMWADLTLEAQLMDHDLDDAWFRIEHPIHQMSSRHLKSSFPSCLHDKENSPKLLRLSPRLPDSVSRSRGKHYTSRKWAEKKHLARKLDAKSLVIVESESVTGCSSTSVVTANSTLRRPPSRLVDDNWSSNVKSILRDERSLSGSVISQYHSSELKPSNGVVKKGTVAKPVSDKVSDSTPCVTRTSNSKGSSKTFYSMTKETGDQRPSHSQKSSSSKSSVGSSYTLGCKLDRINSTAMLEEQRSMTSKNSTRLVCGQKMSERQFPDRNSTSKQIKKSADVKFACRELKSKVLAPAAPRKPLASGNEPKSVKVRVVQQPRLIPGVGKLNQLTESNKENFTGKQIHRSTDVKQGTPLACRKGFPNQKDNTNGGKQGRKFTSAVSRTYFR